MQLLNSEASGGTGPTYASVHRGVRHQMDANYALEPDEDERVAAALSRRLSVIGGAPAVHSGRPTSPGSTSASRPSITPRVASRSRRH